MASMVKKIFCIGALAYKRALLIFFKFFFGVFVLDVCWTLLFFPVIQRGLLSATDKDIKVGGLVSVVMLLTSVVWFFVQAVFFLAMRDTHKAFEPLYYRYGLVRYTQLFVAFSFALLFGVVILASLGVMRFPQLHWSVHVLLRNLGIAITLYWLDSSYQSVGMLASVERGMNLCVYNLGYLLLILGASVGAHYCLGVGINSMMGAPFVDVTKMLAQDHHGWYITPDSLKTVTAALPIVFLKFATFFLDYFFVCCLYVLYVLRRNITYTQSLFEHL